MLKKKKKRFEVRLTISSVALLDLRSRHAAPSSTRKAAGLHEQKQSMKWKKKDQKWVIYPSHNSTCSSLLSLGGFSTWVSILNPCLFCVTDIRSSKLFQTGSCSITSLGAVFFWDPTCCFASLSFPPITCVLIAPLSTQTALGHRWQRDWLSSASHASKTLSQTS